MCRTAASPPPGGAPLGSSTLGGPRASPTIRGSAIWTFPARCPTLGSPIRRPVLSPPRGKFRVTTHWVTSRWVSIGRRAYVFPLIGRHTIGTLPKHVQSSNLPVQSSIPNLPVNQWTALVLMDYPNSILKNPAAPITTHCMVGKIHKSLYGFVDRGLVNFAFLYGTFLAALGVM